MKLTVGFRSNKRRFMISRIMSETIRHKCNQMITLAPNKTGKASLKNVTCYLFIIITLR